MEKILISACLIGEKCRYDGHTNYTPKFKDLLEKYDLIPFCPEVAGGLSTPRNPSEIQKDGTVKMNNGRDVTRQYNTGAEKALDICLALNIKIAILKDRSPSCGSKTIHDGSFSGKTIEGEGITTQLLKRKGIKVISEDEIDTLL